MTLKFRLKREENQSQQQQQQPTERSCTLEKELENKARVIGVEKNMDICSVMKEAIQDYVEREKIRRECKIGLLKSDDPLCK